MPEVDPSKPLSPTYMKQSHSNITFSDIWPGDRLWIMIDVCPEYDEIKSFNDDVKNDFLKLSDLMAHRSCDLGLPCISIIKKTNEKNIPFDVLQGTVMAPFAPISAPDFDVEDHFVRAWSSGISSGFFCHINETTPLNGSMLEHLIKSKNCKILMYGPEDTAYFPNLLNDLQPICKDIWLIKNRVGKKVNQDAFNSVTLSEISEAFDLAF